MNLEIATEQMYDEMLELARRYHDAHPDEDRYIEDYVFNAPAEAASCLLCAYATGELSLTEDEQTLLWSIGYTEGYRTEQLVPDAILKKALPDRRTRPPAPLLFPLRGGGHGPGKGTPGKREFPATWDADTIVTHIMGVATDPDGAAQQPDGTFLAWGIRDRVDLHVLLTANGDVVTAYPVAGEGVVTNPLDSVRAPLVDRIRALIDQADPDDDVRAALEELVDVGEWDQALLQLKALGHPDDELLALADV